MNLINFIPDFHEDMPAAKSISKREFLKTSFLGGCGLCLAASGLSAGGPLRMKIAGELLANPFPSGFRAVEMVD